MAGEQNLDEDGIPVWTEEYLIKHPELMEGAGTYDGDNEDAFDAGDQRV